MLTDAATSSRLIRALTQRTPPIMKALGDLAIDNDTTARETGVTTARVCQWKRGSPIDPKYRPGLFRILKGTIKAAVDLHAELERLGEPQAVLDELQRRIEYAEGVLESWERGNAF